MTSRSTTDSFLAKGDYISIGLASLILLGVLAIYDRINTTQMSVATLETEVKNNSVRIIDVGQRLGKLQDAMTRLRVDVEYLRARDEVRHKNK